MLESEENIGSDSVTRDTMEMFEKNISNVEFELHKEQSLYDADAINT